MEIGALFDTLLVGPMMAGLAWLAAATGSAGIAIIVFTILIRTLMLPLSIYQSKSQKSMMALQPDLKAVQKKYSKDRERLTQETMRLYREHGVNPAAGCLPLLLQLPVFFGLYWALIHLGGEGPEAVEAFRESFLWLPSLASPDAYVVFGALPIPGILPWFMAGSQYVMAKMMQMPGADAQMESMNKMMVVFMPLMLLVFGATFPSGLVLYWAASNIFSIVQQGMITGWGPLWAIMGTRDRTAPPFMLRLLEIRPIRLLFLLLGGQIPDLSRAAAAPEPTIVSDPDERNNGVDDVDEPSQPRKPPPKRARSTKGSRGKKRGKR